jgi:hypothetical protein
VAGTVALPSVCEDVADERFVRVDLVDDGRVGPARSNEVPVQEAGVRQRVLLHREVLAHDLVVANRDVEGEAGTGQSKEVAARDQAALAAKIPKDGKTCHDRERYRCVPRPSREYLNPLRGTLSGALPTLGATAWRSGGAGTVVPAQTRQMVRNLLLEALRVRNKPFQLSGCAL